MSKGRISAAVITAALMMLGSAIDDEEGKKLVSYPDTGGVWTVCGGVTKGIKPGMKFTAAQCDHLTKETREGFLFDVAELVTVDMSPEQLVAHTTFAYNIGINGYRKSRTLRLTNAGDPAAGCRAMMGWFKAGGKSCYLKESDCPGLISRRKREMNKCLAGL